MRRLWALVVLLVVGWLAFGAPASAAVEPPTGILAYTYDQAHPVAAPAHAATERGPPVTTYVDTAHATVDRRPRGAAARLQAVTAWPTTTHTVPAGFVQVARPTTTTSGDAVEIDGDLGALRRWQVAANAGARVGNAASTNYRATFLAVNPGLEGKVVVHHAVEQQVLKRYPGLFTEGQIHSLENLRGIPVGSNSSLHLSQIRRSWNAFYRGNPSPSQADVLNHATDVDRLFGTQFLPPIG